MCKLNTHLRNSTIIRVLPNGKDIVDVIAGEPRQKSDITLFRENSQS